MPLFFLDNKTKDQFYIFCFSALFSTQARTQQEFRSARGWWLIHLSSEFGPAQCSQTKASPRYSWQVMLNNAFDSLSWRDAAFQLYSPASLWLDAVFWCWTHCVNHWQHFHMSFSLHSLTTQQHTDRHRSMAYPTILLQLMLCLQLGKTWAEPIDPKRMSCSTAGEHQCGSCPSHWIAPALTAPAPVVLLFRWGVDKRSRSAGRMGSVCAVCTSLINPQRDSVQIIPHSPTKTQELNSIEFVRKSN